MGSPAISFHEHPGEDLMLRVTPAIWDEVTKITPLWLSIDRIDPPAPLEKTPVNISFSLTNQTGGPVSGEVSGTWGGRQQITNLPNGATTTGAFASTAPAAGARTPVKIQFSKQPIHAAAAPAVAAGGTARAVPPDVETEMEVDVATKYTVSLDKFHVFNPRSTYNDTDFVSLSAQLGNQPILQANRPMGDVHSGADYSVGLHLGPFEVVSGAPAELTFSYLIINKGYSDNVRKVLDQISEATKTALSAAIPAYSGIWSAVDALVEKLVELFTVDCDGVVAGDKVVMSSTELDQLTRARGSYSETRKYPGTPSPALCGEVSHYSVTWTIHRG